MGSSQPHSQEAPPLWLSLASLEQEGSFTFQLTPCTGHPRGAERGTSRPGPERKGSPQEGGERTAGLGPRFLRQLSLQLIPL